MDTGRTGRPPAKQTEIVEDLRGQIVAGRLSPEDRLPTRRELAETYAAGLYTVQQALDTLAEQGFVVPRGTLGTFVAAQPPHLANYAVVFSGVPGSFTAPRFWSALVNEIFRLQQHQRIKIKAYVGINGHTDTEDYQLLLRQVQRRSLAGMIFLAPTAELEGTPLMDEPGIPRVAVAYPIPQLRQLHWVDLDSKAMITRALDYLVARGRRRIGLVVFHGQLGSPGWHEHLVAEMQARRLELQPYWLQSPDALYPQSARNLVHMMLRAAPADRPDALFIADDNFVEHATAGIMAAGLKVPEDLDVVAHCNFPWPTPAALPVRRLGFDCRALLQRCLDAIDALRRNQSVPPLITVAPQFADELPAEESAQMLRSVP